MKNLHPNPARPTPRWTRFRPQGAPTPAKENHDAEKRPPRRSLTIVFRAR